MSERVSIGTTFDRFYEGHKGPFFTESTMPSITQTPTAVKSAFFDLSKIETIVNGAPPKGWVKTDEIDTVEY